ncbi:lymphocyte-specific helicase-like isoform X1 [Hylaeus volcanicus]|uniref:lymphocyte-specific helicase-like isoform X1 n=1 Tax=Hylaeus volcanicus TaxID=313075 RepID=UPI0023B8528E|nr:lymphocyte-specific helicase-like isoform X1 [Hylaeus volcanicus]
MEKENIDVTGNLSNGTSLIAGNPKNLADDVVFSSEPLKENVQEVKRRKRQIESESKQIREEKYNRELQEQQYKRLMHLLNRSKFYSSYIVNKINDTTKNSDKNVNKRHMKEAGTAAGVSPEAKDKRRIYKQNYISVDVQRKIVSKQHRLNSYDESLESELIIDSKNDKQEACNTATETPKFFNGVLRDYQKEGLQWLQVLYENGINGILADEMGLGKTIQVIALICHLIEKQQDGPYLIIAPLSTIPNWMIEFERFAPKLPVFLLHGTIDQRYSIIKKIKQKYKITNTYSTMPIVLTSFEMPLTEKNFMRSLHWRYIIVDEGHRIKNHECQLVALLKQCKSMNRLLLTGTPLQNNLAELWSLLNFLLPEIFDDLAVFESWFDAKELEYDEGTKKFLKQEEEKHVLSSLREILQPFMLRREKSDVCLDVPAKKELIVYAPLTVLQHDLYKAVLNRDIEKLSLMDNSPIIYTEDGKRPKRRCTMRNVFNSNLSGYAYDLVQEIDESIDNEFWRKQKPVDKSHLTAWKQYTDVTDRNRDYLLNIKSGNRVAMYKKIVNHPYLVHCPLDPSGLPKIDDDLIKSSGKLLVLDAMLAKLKEQGHKVLLFSTMTMVLDVIEDYLSLRDYDYVRLDGNTPLEVRKENIKNFTTNPDLFLFLISTRAGGVGLNLASADTVIMYDCDWNPQMDIQAMARCHRIGQVRPVVVYKLCVKGTIDESIITRGEKKRFLEKAVISKIDKISVFDKESLLRLKELLESKECQVVAAENQVFTEEELNKLLDRSDLYEK